MAKTKTKGASEKGGQGIIYTLIAILTVSIATFSHESMHSAIAWLNGWSSEPTASLLTGQTTAILPIASPTVSVWIFYMLPSLLIFAITTAAMLLKPDKFVLVVGSIFQFLNLTSLYPAVTGSDAGNAVQFIIQRGWTEANAYGLHYIIFFVIFITWAGVLYISTENNPKDAKARIKRFLG